MKQFIVDRHTTPNTPTLEQVPTEKIPIYNDIDAVTADLANLEVGQIVATKDTGSELSAPVDTVQSGNMHAVTSNAVAESLSYSTTEQKTGGTWIDGKPIYRKVLQETFISNGTIDISALNIGHLIDLKGELTNSYNDQIFMNSTFADSNTVASVTYNTGRKEITMFSTATWTENRPVIIIVEYTKTTD